MNPKLTCIVPCYQRPQRTLRLIECIMNQVFTGYQAIFIGDGCPDFQQFIDDGRFAMYEMAASLGGNQLLFINLPQHEGGYGTFARRKGIDLACGDYTIFVDNDDVIKNNHFSHLYFFMMERPYLDFGYSNVFVEPLNHVRNAELKFGSIGHAELIVKTEILKKEYEINALYGHDWDLIAKLLRKGYTHEKSNAPPTYIVKSLPNLRETNID